MSDLAFGVLIEAFERLEKTRSGNEMMEILAELFQKTPVAVIDLVSYFIQGSVVAEHEDVNLNIGERLMAEAIARAAQNERKEIDSLYVQRGDYGLVAQEVLKGRSRINTQLTVKVVHDRLMEIANATGEGSQEAKLNILSSLLAQASPTEAKYIVRIVLGILRLGAGTMTILNALAKAFTGEKKNKAVLEKAYNLCGDVGLVAKTLAQSGLEGVSKIGIKVGHPIKMMAAQRVKKLEELFEKLPEGFAIEEKYDGERVQCHKTAGPPPQIKIFSRNLEDITYQYPDVVQYIREHIPAKEAIVEGEVVAVAKNGSDQLLDFQTLMQRKRKYDIEKYVEEIPIKLFLFDVLYVDGQSTMEWPYPKRRELLEKITKKSERVELARALVTNDLGEIEDFFEEAVDRGLEGIMAKSCASDSIYRAGAREWSWIKWKKDYSAEMADTLDLVVVGGFAGRGKRSGTWGALLCAAYNPQQDRFETVCKVSTGFTDEELKEIPRRLKPYESKNPPARLFSKMQPTIWFEPKFVIEVQGAELTRSPIHTCAADSGPGIALRFPRFNRFRDDKSPEQATTVEEIKAMYEATHG